MYRQITLAGLLGHGRAPRRKSRRRLPRRARRLARLPRHYNNGRGVVLIGHSQGSFVLRQLIAQGDRQEAEGARAADLGGPARRQRLVKKGKDVGGDFKHVRACRSRTQTGCVIAFSTFDETAARRRHLRPHDRRPGMQVLCTNPAALGGGSAKIDADPPERAVRARHDDRGRDRGRRRPAAEGRRPHGASARRPTAARCSAGGAQRARDHAATRRADAAPVAGRRPGACTSSTRTSRSAT